MYFEWLNKYTVGPPPLLCNGSFFLSRRTMKNPSIHPVSSDLKVSVVGRFNCIRLIHSGFPFLKWSCSREFKFLSYSHPSQLVPSTAVTMVPFDMRPSRCFVLILSPAPSPSDASHLGYCKHKRLTVMNHAHYKIGIYHTTCPLFQSMYQYKDSPLASEEEKQVRTFTHFNNCTFMLGQVGCIVEKSWTKWILPTTWLSSFGGALATALPFKRLPRNLL